MSPSPAVRLAFALLLGLASLVLAGCSSGGEGTDGGSAPGAAARSGSGTAAPTAGLAADPTDAPQAQPGDPSMTPDPNAKTEVATLAAGCFWCVEAVLEQVKGIVAVESGYMGGRIANPTYKQVCTGSTGHAEVVQVSFDPAVISYADVLDWFWRLHDPTTLNRQGNDVGTQYRSAIFVHSPAQRAVAEKSLGQAQPHFPKPIVTEITDAGPFYPAEGYHQDYYRLNKAQGYCRLVIAPKLDKLGLEK